MKESTVIGVLRETYENRLRKSLSEVDLVDADGKVIVSPDLKVRDKRSGYEYTVDSVREDETGKKLVVLRPPDSPRFEPPPEAPEVLSAAYPELDVYVPGAVAAEQSTALVVHQNDFEKNFEVE